MNVVWLKNAQDKYHNTLNHLTQNFSAKTAQALENEVRKCVEFFKAGILLGNYTKKKNSYKYVIKGYNLLVYTVVENDVIIIDFVATRTDHDFND